MKEKKETIICPYQKEKEKALFLRLAEASTISENTTHNLKKAIISKSSDYRERKLQHTSKNLWKS